MTARTPLECVERARIAFPFWSRHTVGARTRSLQTLRRIIAVRRDEIVATLCRETGKPPLDALAGDVMVTLEQMLYYEKHAARLLRRRPVKKPPFLYTGARFSEDYEPYGVALVYAPANYPFQLAMIPAITALYAGNAVVLKCSEGTPETARLIASIFAQSPLPEGLVHVAADPMPAAAEYLDAHPDMVFFTGSCANGRTVARRAGELVIPTVLELGGKDAAVVFADCHLARALEGIIFGAFSNSGRVCVGIRRLLVEESIYSEFLHGLGQRAAALRSGAGPESDLGAPVRPNTRWIAYAQQALSAGAKLVYPDAVEKMTGGPVILADVPSSSPLLQDETFGPVLCVAPFRDEADALAQANASPFALSASIWSRDLPRARRLAAALTAGSCAINDVIRNIANPYASFGGNHQSGYGRYHGPQGLYAFSRIKSVMTTNGARTREIHWFPFHPKTFARLDALLGMRHAGDRWAKTLRRLFQLVLFCGALSCSTVHAAEGPAHLKITVTAPPNSHGPLAYLIFTSKDGFPDKKAKAVRSGFFPASESSRDTTFDIGPLPPGRYAVSVYQDVNNNHRLDHGMFGIPKEPVGASNNPKPSFGPPHFDQCTFQMTQSGQTIPITLIGIK